MWGFDIIGSFPMSTTQAKFIFMASDYFTKWVKAVVVFKITQFVAWIIYTHRFKIPQHIVMDNESVSIDELRHYSSIHNLQCKEQIEVTNRAIVQGLKKKAKGAKGPLLDLLLDTLGL